MILEGKVKAGLGEAAFWVKKIENIFCNTYNIKLFSGTLNLELKEEYKINEPDLIIEAKEYGGTEKLFIKKCIVYNRQAYIIRTEKNQSSCGDHSLNIIEVVSDIKFREKYNLLDDQKIKIEIN